MEPVTIHEINYSKGKKKYWWDYITNENAYIDIHRYRQGEIDINALKESFCKNIISIDKVWFSSKAQAIGFRQGLFSVTDTAVMLTEEEVKALTIAI